MHVGVVVGTILVVGCGHGASKPVGPHPIDVAVTDDNTAVVMSDGSVRAWGLARRGALGWLANRDAAVPTAVPGIAGAHEVVAGGFGLSSTLCARAADGWYCWGNAARIPTAGVVRWEKFAIEDGRIAAPARIDGFATIKRLRLGPMVAAPPAAGCAVLADDSLACWRADWSERYAEPGPVMDVSIGLRHACALAQDRRVWCWGVATYGAVDATPSETRLVDRPVVVPGVTGARSIVVGDDVSCADLAGTDKLVCWGATFYGKGVVTLDATPGGQLFAGGADICEARPDHTVRCLDHRAKYWCPYGIDDRGAKCDAGIVGHDTPPWRDVDATPASVIAIGREHACAITTTGTLECSGRNDHGELGDGSLVDHPDARTVLALEPPITAPADPPSPTHAHRGPRWDQAPPGCVHDAFLAGMPAPLAVESAWVSEHTGLMVLRDYRSGFSDDDLRGNEHELKLDFDSPMGGEPPTIPFAEPLDGAATVLGVLRASDGDVAWFGPATGTDPRPDAGTITVTVHSDRWVCGTIDAHAGLVALRGRFAAEIAP